MTQLLFQGEGVVRDGALRLNDPARWRSDLAGLEGQRLVVTVEKPGTRRSSQQNRWYFGVIVPMVAQYLSKGRPFQLHPDQAHYLLKSAFLGVLETPLGVVAKSTAKLSTVEFSDYCDRIVAHAGSEWGLAIPQPEAFEVDL